MAGRLLVSLGTDGFTDWVRLPTGQRFNLGPISVLGFVSKLLGKGRGRHVVEAYLRDGEAMLSVDEDRLWELFTPVRARWASGDGPFMALDLRTARKNMPTIRDDLAALETHIAALNNAAPLRAAKKISDAKMQEGLGILTKLANKIKSPNQSKNDTYYGYGTPPLFEVGDAEPKPFTVEASAGIDGVSGLAFDVLQTNSTTAQGILAKAGEVVVKIDQLAAAGKKFNAAKAKADVHAVTSKVAGILKTDLTASWVQDDLTKLAAKTDHLHKLFASAKV